MGLFFLLCPISWTEICYCFTNISWPRNPLETVTSYSPRNWTEPKKKTFSRKKLFQDFVCVVWMKSIEIFDSLLKLLKGCLCSLESERNEHLNTLHSKWPKHL